MIRKAILNIVESYGSWSLRAHAKSIGATEYSFHGLKVMCQLRNHSFVKEAVEKAKEYDEAIWDDIKSTIKLIIIAKGNSDSWELVTKSMVIIFNQDKSHMSTSTHFAGWIFRHYTVIKEGQKAGVGQFGKDRRSNANIEGQRLRQDFLAPKLKNNPNQKLQPTVKTPVESGNVQGTAAEL